MSLLKFWLLRFLFAGTLFFADGASAIASVDGGGGNGSDGAGSSGADGSDSGAGGEGSESDSQTEGGEGEDTEVSDGTDGERLDPNAETALADGRKVPAKYKELFEKDKDLRAIYFANQALKRTFPGGVKEAVALARQIDEFGGVEGIERLQGDLNAYTADAEAFNSGDPKWTAAAFEENSDLALKHFANALGYVSEHHPEHYDHWMAKVIVNDLSALPLNEIHGILAGLKDNPRAQEAAKALANYYNSRKKFADKAPERQIDPQQRKIDEQKQQLTQKEQEIRNKTINAEANPYLTRTIDSSVSAAAKTIGFDLAKLAKEQPNRYGRFIKDVKNAVHREVLNDTRWLDRYSEALNAGDTQKCIRMLNKRHDQAIRGTEDKPGVASVILREWFGTGKAGARRPASGGASGAGSSTGRSGSGSGDKNVVLVNTLPPAKDIDYSWDGTDKWAGKYRLKTGKLIQVKRA